MPALQEKPVPRSHSRFTHEQIYKLHLWNGKQKFVSKYSVGTRVRLQ